MEMADAIVINKADGSNKDKAELARREYKNALHLFPATASGWEVPVECCSAIEHKGINEVWKIVERYRSAMTKESDYFFHKRNEQMVHAMYDSINRKLSSDFYNNAQVKASVAGIEKQVLEGKMSAYQAAASLLETFRDSVSDK